jgi:hypothetical protein
LPYKLEIPEWYINLKKYIGSRMHLVYHYKNGTLCKHTNKHIWSLTVNYINKFLQNVSYLQAEVMLDKIWGGEKKEGIFNFAPQ